jgi:hypothetical protein
MAALAARGKAALPRGAMTVGNWGWWKVDREFPADRVVFSLICRELAIFDAARIRSTSRGCDSLSNFGTESRRRK